MRIWLIASFLLAACASVPASEPENYGALRFSADESKLAFFATLVAEAEAAREEAWGSGPVSEQPDRCVSESLSRDLMAPWVRLANGATSYADWQRDEAALLERLAIVAEIEAAYLAGREIDGRYAPNAQRWSLDAFAAERNATTDGRLQELFTRGIRDQLYRMVTHGEGAAPFLDGLSENARREWPFVLALAHIDCSNTAWLRSQVAAHGWFDISRYGERADEVAWLIVQHADRTPAFQGEMLTFLQERAEAGETLPRRVAYLSDRVAVKEGRPQRYGTQMACEGAEAQPIGGLEDPEHIEDRLAALGMTGYAAYRSMITRLAGCAD